MIELGLMSVYNVSGTLTFAATVCGEFELVALTLLGDSKRSTEKASAATIAVINQFKVLKLLVFIKVAFTPFLF